MNQSHRAERAWTRRNRRLEAVTAALGAALVVGCADDDPARFLAEPTVRDSATIRIVEYGPDALAAVERWTLSPRGLDIGGARSLADGSAEGRAHEFTRVLGAATLPGDTTVVVDAGAGELRYFAPDGRHVRTAGRPGDGPGEFGFLLSAFLLAPDTIAAWDVRSQRITLVDGTGHVAGEISIGSAARARGLTFLTRLPGGDWAGRTRNLWYLSAEALPQSTIRDSVAYVRVAAGGDRAEIVASMPNSVLDVRPRTIGGRTQRLAFPRLFSPNAHVEGGAGRVVTGISDRFELTVHATNGRRTLLRADPEPRPVTPAHVEAEIQAMRERLRGRPADEIDRELTALRETPAMDRFPAFDRVRVGRDGSVWVRRYGAPGDEVAEWVIFGPDGQLRARLPLPAETDVLEASLADVLLLQRDELDVERVSRRRLSAAAPASN